MFLKADPKHSLRLIQEAESKMNCILESLGKQRLSLKIHPNYSTEKTPNTKALFAPILAHNYTEALSMLDPGQVCKARRPELDAPVSEM